MPLLQVNIMLYYLNSIVGFFIDSYLEQNSLLVLIPHDVYAKF